MSTRKGNNSKRAQKFQNTSAFKNNLHDSTLKQKQINGFTISGVCARCQETIDWKRKYKKYKPLTAPKTCVKCKQKTIKHAYHTLCTPCAQAAGVCEKCGKNEEVVTKPGISAEEQAAQDAKLQQELRTLSERQRRTFFRHLEKGEGSGGASVSSTQDDDSDDDMMEDHDQLNDECES